MNPKHRDACDPSPRTMTGRREWIAQCFLASGAVATLSQANLLASSLETTTQEDGSASKAITAEMVRAASWLSRVPLDDAQCEQIAKGLNAKAKSIEALRSTPIDENTAMAMTFMPWYFVEGAGNLSSHEAESVSSDPSKEQGNWRTQDIQLPSYQAPEDAAFWSVRQLAVGLRRKLFSSVQLTQMYLDRLKKYDPVLHCVVNYHGRALDEARIADEELSQGKDRGILHGIPWGAKDIISIPGMPTTWGAIDYKDTVRESLATVAKRMKEAGAILLAKLSVGTLAWGDKWFSETTRNPWDTSKGSSGSSAGSASATVAGLCGFAIGSETLGSIVSPTRVCCTSGLRPTFGRVSRFGCMTLGWSMDKIGPIARHVEDCAWIFEAMIGVDGLDASVVDRPFSWPVEKLDLTKLRVGVPKNLRRSEGLISELFRAAGATMVEIDFPADPRINAMSDAISVEAATMHGDLFEKIEKDSQVGEWGPSFREAQFCSAIDYVQAMRARVDLVQKTEIVLRGVDVLIGDGNLTRMNLTGHPSLVVSFGANEEQSRPNTVVLTSKFFAESELLQSGIWIQEQLPPLPSEPPISTPEAEKTE